MAEGLSAVATNAMPRPTAKASRSGKSKPAPRAVITPEIKKNVRLILNRHFLFFCIVDLGQIQAERSASTLPYRGFQPAAFSFLLLPEKSTNMSSTQQGWTGD